jgi:hypothetical protein
MKKILFIAIGLLLAGSCAAGATDSAAPLARNFTSEFISSWDATRDQPMPQRVAAMKRTLMPLYPEFYGRGTAEEQDAKIALAIERFPSIRTAYVDKSEKFGGALQQHLKTFNVAFPKFRLTAPTSVLHSLGEMDGGTRTLGGKEHLIFGADVIARTNPDGDPAALFHHELFHVLHQERFQCEAGAVWEGLWREGLAVYVSHVLNPKANDTELLLNHPRGMVATVRANLPAAWAELQTSLDSSEQRINQELFTTSIKDTAMPMRRGYYLGYLVAQEAAKTRDLPTLAALDCMQARELVGVTVSRLAKEATR